MATTLNDLNGVHRHGPDTIAHDIAATKSNLEQSAWKSWPNEAGFDNLDEHRGPLPLKVTGSIPAWAAGSLYRAGPGQSKLETAKGTHYVSHWFDGFAHTHKFDILPNTEGEAQGETRVEYSSRRQGEAYVDKVRQRGWRSHISFGQRSDPCVGIFAKVMSVFEPAGHADGTYNVVIQPNLPGMSKAQPSSKAPSGHRAGAKNIFVTTDAAGMQQLDPDTLESLDIAGPRRMHPDLVGELAASHGARDPATGDHFNYNLKLGPSPTFRIFRTSAETDKTEILATFSAPPAYIHSMYLTENFVILCISGARFGKSGIDIPLKRSMCAAILPFSQDMLTQWYVVDRRHGKGVVGRFTTPAGFFFHTVNAYEEITEHEDGTETTDILADVVHYDTPDIISVFYYDVILGRNHAFEDFYGSEKRRDNARAALKRFKLSMPSTFAPSAAPSHGQEVFSISAPHVGELPTINPRYATKPHRYVYSTPTRHLSTLVDCIAKTDTVTGETLIWSGPRGSVPGEAIFVPRPGGMEEDDGVLLSMVLDGVKGTSFLLCLNATDLKELGRAEADFAMGVGFHGAHVAEGQAAAS